MVAFNDVDLQNTFASLTAAPGGVPIDLVSNATAFFVTVNATAGEALFDGGGTYNMSIVVLDMTALAVVSSQNQGGAFGDANWPAQTNQFSFPIPAQGPGKTNHIYWVIGVVTAGKI